MEILLCLILVFCGSCAYQDSKVLNDKELEKTKEYSCLTTALAEKDEAYKLVIMNNSEFSDFPVELLELTNLQILLITGCECDFIGEHDCVNIKNIPEGIDNLHKLEELYLGMNQLENLPQSIANLSMLKVLDLSDNIGIDLQAVYSIVNLESLYLNGCDISYLDAEISQLKKLKVLGLSNNPISESEEKVIRGYLPNCQIFFD